MRKLAAAVSLCAMLICRSAFAQPAAGDRAVVRLSPALDAIVSADARLETLKRDYFGALEGPLWVPSAEGGFLVFSDLAANVIY